MSRPFIIAFIPFVLLAFQASSLALYTDGVTMPHKVTTFNPDRGPAVSAGLSFSASFTVLVDGVPVRVELPSAFAAQRVIRVRTFVGDPERWNEFSYDVASGKVRFAGRFGERVYDRYNDPTMAYVVLERMTNIMRAAFAQMGLNFDPATGDLTIDRAYVDRINSELGVTVNNSADKVHILLAYGDEAVGFTLDKASGRVSYPSDIMFASAYEWDIAAGQTMALTDDPYGGVAAAAPVIDTPTTKVFKGWYIRFMPMPAQLATSCIVFADHMRYLYNDISTVVYPKERLPDPEIVDIEWVDRANGLIKIEGRGGTMIQPPEVYVKRSGTVQKLGDGFSWLGDTWSLVNYSSRLGDGENKVNVILRGTGNRESESGDVTVYRGQGGEPDLILLSPRDREVYASEKFPFSTNSFKLRGKTAPGSIISIFGQTRNVDGTGDFDFNVASIALNEGRNIVSIDVSSLDNISIQKNVVIAYKFICDTKEKTYVLRKGDIVFNGKSPNNQAFDFIPYEPNHAGVYIGSGQLIEAVKRELYIPGEVLERNMEEWDKDGFYYATQVPRLVDEDMRNKVVQLIIDQKGKPYEYPFHFGEETFSCYYYLEGGQYSENGRFYCSELAYWAWEKIGKQNGFDFGIVRQKTMYPEIGIDDPNNCSILPAFLCRECMEAKIIE